MASNLAPVYLDDTRVTLQGDPRPQVSKILQAGGKQAGDGLVVLRLHEAQGAAGQPLALSEVIDREKAITPVYLRVVKTEGQTAAPAAPGDILRGTDPVSSSQAGEQSARAGRSQRFAESQSFADPAHKGGSPRTAHGARPSREAPQHDDQGIRSQQTGSEGGAGSTLNPRRTTTTTTTSRGSLEKASEEE